MDYIYLMYNIWHDSSNFHLSFFEKHLYTLFKTASKLNHSYQYISEKGNFSMIIIIFNYL